MLYLVSGHGGTGHNFLLSLIAHSLDNNGIPIKYGVGANAHSFTNNYVSDRLNYTEKLGPGVAENLYKLITDIPFDYVLPTVPDIDLDDVAKYHTEFKLVLVSMEKEDEMEVITNHFLKQFGLSPKPWPAMMASLATKNVEKLNDLPIEDISNIINSFKDGQDVPLTYEYSESYKDRVFTIPYRTLMYDKENTLLFIENVTNTKRSKSLSLTYDNYNQKNIKLREKYSLLYPKY